jgi:RNA recognition motif-containing protein
MGMPTTVFVDGLAPQLTNERLQAFFHPYGSFRVIIATSKAGACLGFGFVVFANPAQAAHAIEVLNGAELLGKRIRVCAKISPNLAVEAGVLQ